MLLSSGMHRNPLPLLADSLPASARRKKLEAYLNTVTGGLVNLVSKDQTINRTLQRLFPTADNLKSMMTVQLMHQTCKEWVEAATFKHVVLGSRAGSTPENGHSFLTRFWAYQLAMFGEPDELAAHVKRFAFHAVEAERTTGISQYDFLRSLSGSFYEQLGLYRVGSAASFAVHQGLWLYLEDAFHNADTSIAESEEWLFSILWRSENGNHVVPDARAVETSKLLLRLGFQASLDPIGVSRLASRMVRCQARRQDTMSFEELFQAAISTTLAAHTAFPGFQREAPFDFLNTLNRFSLITLGPPRLVEWILERHPDYANYDTQLGTPLDHLVGLFDNSPSATVEFLGMDWLFEHLSILVRHGGCFKIASETMIRNFFRYLSQNRYEVAPLMRDVAPGLCLTGEPTTEQYCWLKLRIRRLDLPEETITHWHQRLLRVARTSLQDDELSDVDIGQQTRILTSSDEPGLEPLELEGWAIQPEEEPSHQGQQVVAGEQQLRPELRPGNPIGSQLRPSVQRDAPRSTSFTDQQQESSRGRNGTNAPPSSKSRLRTRAKLLGIFGGKDPA
ncbi:uncharacterized protein B0I36DRAFT_354285 [Microdochium trichocladiopsis]|uniref:Uncharacterized protein n=1 Tax=Microdochium trichocladiopsis TaxID=1682393 RepID=A0A9P9BMM5_9PEZI|nr:uncharacterized protein B0I36DRAFT_354285 [Microdochium trichocladiopsis]KAH7017957.1 hypothetical protein B0I36DRAFT_354285 [Microdochium trichocladiopsis]